MALKRHVQIEVAHKLVYVNRDWILLGQQARWVLVSKDYPKIIL
jgi:hypothetical protein